MEMEITQSSLAIQNFVLICVTQVAFVKNDAHWCYFVSHSIKIQTKMIIKIFWFTCINTQISSCVCFSARIHGSQCRHVHIQWNLRTRYGICQLKISSDCNIIGRHIVSNRRSFIGNNRNLHSQFPVLVARSLHTRSVGDFLFLAGTRKFPMDVDNRSRWSCH